MLNLVQNRDATAGSVHPFVPGVSGFQGLHAVDYPPHITSLKRRARLAIADDVDAIWNFYLETGFLYQAKLESMGDHGAKARETLKTLLSMNSDDYRICLSLNDQGRITALCTQGRFSDTQAWVMHLASARDKAALAAVLKDCCSLTSESEAEWVAYTFRENNRGVRRLFTSALSQLQGDIESSVYDYYLFDASQSKVISESADVRLVRNATEADRLQLLDSMSCRSDRAALKAVGPLTEGLSVGSVAQRQARYGLTRKRAAFAITLGDGTLGLAIADISPEWWNFSELSAGVRIFTSHESTAATRQLLAAVANWFAENGVNRWTTLIGSEDAAMRSVLSELGFSSTKRYQRMGVPNAITKAVSRSYLNLINRHERETSITVDADSNCEALAA